MSPTSYRTAPPRDKNDYITTARVSPLLDSHAHGSARCLPGPMPKATGWHLGRSRRAYPKIHLHCHLEGCLRGPTFVELAEKHGVPLRYHPSGAARNRRVYRRAGRARRSLADPYRFKDFEEFLLIFAAVSRSLAGAGRLRAARARVRRGCTRAAGDLWRALRFAVGLDVLQSRARRSRDDGSDRRPSCAPRGRARRSSSCPISRETSARPAR